MKSTNHLFRQWCKKCNDFELHQRVFKDELTHPSYSLVSFEEGKDFASICECGCQYSAILIKDIDSDKLQEQRLRFKAQRSAKFKRTMNAYMMVSNPLEEIFNQDFGMKTIITESDAGLEDEEAQLRIMDAEEKNRKKEELLTFKNVGRNDICLCGSNLKYKKCCLLKHNNYFVK